MHYIFISGSYPQIHCGIGDYTANLVTALSAAGDEITVITSKNVLVTTQKTKGVRILPLVTSWNKKGRKQIQEALALITEPVGAVIIQYPTQQYGRNLAVNFLPFRLRNLAGQPLTVATIHEFASFTWLGRLRIGLLATLSQRVISTDLGNYTLMKKYFPWLRQRLKYVPIGINIPLNLGEGDDRDKTRGPLEINLLKLTADRFTSDTFVILFWGYLSPSKGFLNLLKALEIIETTNHKGTKAEDNLNWRLLIVGESEPREEKYRSYHLEMLAQIKVRNLDPKITWTGYVATNEVAKFLLAGDVSVLPFADGASSRRTSLLATLALGIPTISTRVPGQSLEPLFGQENQLALELVPPDDPEALAEAIRKLYNDPELRRTLGERGKQATRERTWPNIATNFKEALS